MQQRRRRLCLGLSAAWPLAAWPAVDDVARAPAWPARPVRLLVPFAAGGPADALARALAQPMGEQLGQTVFVENRPGAGGSLAAEAVARAAPDGHTLLLATTSTHSIAPLLNPRLPYDPEADFTPIVAVGTAPGMFLVPGTSPASTLQEFIALARRQPGRLSYGSSGVGTIVHLATEQLKAETGTFIVHIPYRGTSLALADLASGTIDLLIDSVVTALPLVRAGRVRALAITSPASSPLVPELPPASGLLPGFEAVTLFSLYAPRALPADRAARLNEVANRALSDAALRERFSRSGAEAVGGSAEQLVARVRSDTARWRRVVVSRGIKLD